MIRSELEDKSNMVGKYYMGQLNMSTTAEDTS